MTLCLERKEQFDKTAKLAAGDAAVGMLTPPIAEDYWAYRVKLSEKQAIVGFPKFSTIGIGFAVEEDWNTNLPYTCETERIFQHIHCNKGDAGISDDACREAIAMIKQAVFDDKAAKNQKVE